MTKIQLISNWSNDGKDYPWGSKLDVADDQAQELIALGAAKPLTSDNDEITPVNPTGSTLVGEAGQVGPSDTTPQINPAAPTPEQIQEDLNKAGLGESEGSQQG